MKTIVIFGGMFDPPHVGHALDVDNVRANFVCDEIWFTPSGSRLDKSSQTSNDDRWRMAQIFCEDYFPESKTPVVPMRDEMDMSPPTYTWALFRLLTKKYPGHEFHFLLGSINLATIKQWQHGEELFNTVRFLITPQGEDLAQYDMPPHSAVLEGGRVTTNLSSTFIRERLKNGFSPLPYVLPRIAGYIKEKNLYQE